MDSVLKEQFERIETALNTLVESIASYNPSPQAALDLVAADDDLSNGLDQLSRHQANHTRILNLRAEAEALETQLRNSVSTLAALRHDLFDTPATTFSESSRPVPFGDLLQYAKNISRHTVPPTYREDIPKTDGEPPQDNDKEAEGASSALPSAAPSGTGTPAIANAPSSTNAIANGNGVAADAAQAPPDEQLQVTAEQADWLRKLSENKVPWVPWPDNDKIRRGNLMMIQQMLDQGKDPWTDKIPTMQELEEQLEKQEEQNQNAQVQQEPIVVPRRQTGVHMPEQPVEQFTGFDFDEE